MRGLSKRPRRTQHTHENRVGANAPGLQPIKALFLVLLPLGVRVDRRVCGVASVATLWREGPLSMALGETQEPRPTIFDEANVPVDRAVSSLISPFYTSLSAVWPP